MFEGEWHPWCQVSPAFELGETAKEQCDLIRKAHDEGTACICGHENLEEAQKAVDWIKRHRPMLELKAVDGPCTRKDRSDFEDYGND